MSMHEFVSRNQKGLMWMSAGLIVIALVIIAMWLYYRNKSSKCSSSSTDCPTNETPTTLTNKANKFRNFGLVILALGAVSAITVYSLKG